MTTQSLTKTQHAARKKFEAIIGNPALADELYSLLPESQGGKIISTDTARFLDASYRNAPRGRLRDMAPSWEGASAYARDRLHREIINRAGRHTLRFMAGGWASGKSYALSTAPAADLSWDGTLSDSAWAADQIIQAMECGWRIHLAYIQRPIELAMWGALDRAAEEGRAVPLLELPCVHREAQQSILRLLKRFGSDPRVSFLLLLNDGTRATPSLPRKLSISQIAARGSFHYSAADVESYQHKAREIWQAAAQSGHYTAEVLAAASKGMGT
jgi:Zeta toxin